VGICIKTERGDEKGEKSSKIEIRPGKNKIRYQGVGKQDLH